MLRQEFQQETRVKFISDEKNQDFQLVYIYT